jgi:hypothetical protein
MTLGAESISASILPGLSTIPRSGSVHSVFSRTVNILSDEVTWLSLHPGGTPMHPYAVTVPVERFAGVAPGDPVTLSRSGIRLKKQALAIDLRRAEPWDPLLLPAEGGDGIDLGYLLDRLICLIGTGPVASPFLAATLGNPAAATDTWSRALWSEAASITREIKAGLRASSPQAVLGAATRALGLGVGFTPSGDDYLTGLIGAYWYMAPGDRMGEALRAGISPMIHRTSLPSAFMLKAALLGRLPEPLAGLLRALGQGVEADPVGALTRLTGAGATSGEDTLAGVITYLDARAGVGWAYAAN